MTAAEWTPRPARGHTNTHPPFEAGNSEALKHGANSVRRWKPIADQLAAELLGQYPWLARFEAAVWAWARVEAQCWLIGDWLDQVGLLDDQGEPRPASNRLDRLEARAQSLRNDLPLTPMALAKLTSTLAGSPDQQADVLAGLLSIGAEIRASREVPELPVAPLDGSGRGDDSADQAVER
jgi:hypothetical protein